jgi:prepilin-type N-terminal cleavage/methylation domain-containing protein
VTAALARTTRAARDRFRRVVSGRGNDAGFSLLEVVVSFVIFAIVAGSATAAIVSALRASHGSQQRVDAAQVAQAFVAQTQASPGAVQPETNQPYTASVKNEQFTVSRSIVFSNSGTTSCTSGMYFTVHVTVAQAQTGKFLARSDSVVTC